VAYNFPADTKGLPALPETQPMKHKYHRYIHQSHGWQRPSLQPKVDLQSRAGNSARGKRRARGDSGDSCHRAPKLTKFNA